MKTVLVIVVVVLAVGCGLEAAPTSGPTELPPATTTPTELPPATRTATELPPTTTPPPAASKMATPSAAPIPTLADCVDAKFVRETVPDGSIFQRNERFTKEWVMASAGCEWPEGTEFAFVEGHILSARSPVAVALTEVGSTVRIGVDMLAPASPGRYKGLWQMRGPGGTWFGTKAWVDIVVEGQPTATESPTPAETLLGPEIVVAEWVWDAPGNDRDNAHGEYVLLRNVGGPGRTDVRVVSVQGGQSVSFAGEWAEGTEVYVHSGCGEWTPTKVYFNDQDCGAIWSNELDKLEVYIDEQLVHEATCSK